MIFYLGSASPIAEPSKIGLKGEGMSDRHNSNWCSKVGCFFCGFLVREDCCSNEDSIPQQQSGEEDALFCTLCNAEVDASFLKNIIMFFHTASNKVKWRKPSIAGKIEKENSNMVF